MELWKFAKAVCGKSLICHMWWCKGLKTTETISVAIYSRSSHRLTGLESSDSTCNSQNSWILLWQNDVNFWYNIFFDPIILEDGVKKNCDVVMSTIKIFIGGAGVVTPSRFPPLTNNFCLFCCFRGDSLMTPTPSTTPPPYKNYDWTLFCYIVWNKAIQTSEIVSKNYIVPA